MSNISKIENRRQIIQSDLDKAKSQEERNVMGQFSTPISLATEILEHAKCFISENDKIRFLDPSIGTGSFYSALNSMFPAERIEAATGYEIDPHYGNPSLRLWANSILEYNIADFTKAKYPKNEKDKFNLIICNPPYVRHHHFTEEKKRLQEMINSSNMKLSGLAGLYCYFIALSHNWMKLDGIAGWLIPSEFMDVNYGEAVKKYLLNEVTLLQIHRYDPKEVQFDDALVTSSVVWFKNSKPPKDHSVKFTYGGTLKHPYHEKNVDVNVLMNEKKWTRFPLLGERSKTNYVKLKDFFTIKRGIATGDNAFFILSKSEIDKQELPMDFFRPILPSPRYLSNSIIQSNIDGIPCVDNELFVLDCSLSLDEIKKNFPTLYRYLNIGKQDNVSERYLCKNRKLWYEQERRKDSLFYCTYMGRPQNKDSKPFRFILNRSKAIVTNSYLILYPNSDLDNLIKQNPEFVEKLYKALNNISEKSMIEEGRVYGGGLHKLEPKELSNLPAIEIQQLINGLI